MTNCHVIDVALGSTRHTFSDVVDAAEKASSVSDCCEDCSGKVANIYGSLRVGIVARLLKFAHALKIRKAELITPARDGASAGACR